VDTDIVAGVVYYYAVCCAHDGLLGPPSTPDTGYVSIIGASPDPNVIAHDDQVALNEGGDFPAAPDASGAITVR
jgi:hypothetical protein